MVAFKVTKAFNRVQLVFFHEGVVLVFIPLAVEQITTHMSAGPPISSLNLGFLPQINRTLLPTRFGCIKSLMNDVFFNQVKSVFVALPAASRPGKNLRYYSVAIVACVSVDNGESGKNFIF